MSQESSNTVQDIPNDLSTSLLKLDTIDEKEVEQKQVTEGPKTHEEAAQEARAKISLVPQAPDSEVPPEPDSEAQPTHEESSDTTLEKMFNELIETVKNINNSNELKEFAKECVQSIPRILEKGGDHKNGDYWVKGLENNEKSKELASTIDKQKTKLLNLEKTNARLGRQLKLIENTKNGLDLTDLLSALARDRYLVIKGKGDDLTITEGTRFGGKELAEEATAKRKKFLKNGLTSSLGDILKKYKK